MKISFLVVEYFKNDHHVVITYMHTYILYAFIYNHTIPTVYRMHSIQSCIASLNGILLLSCHLLESIRFAGHADAVNPVAPLEPIQSRRAGTRQDFYLAHYYRRRRRRRRRVHDPSQCVLHGETVWNPE